MITPHHFCYDFCRVDRKLLSDPMFISGLLTNIVVILNMTPCGDPIIEQMIDPHDPDNNNGITAVQIIKESLIDIHTYPNEECIYISVFSCRQFNQAVLHDFLATTLASRTCYVMGVRRMAISDKYVNRN